MKTPESAALDEITKELKKLNKNLERIIFEMKQADKPNKFGDLLEDDRK